MSLKQAIRKHLEKRNLELRKFPGIQFRSLPVFNLVVRYHMERRGEKMSFVQIGANDGKLGDPLRKFIVNYDWHGVLVEPQTLVYERLS